MFQIHLTKLLFEILNQSLLAEYKYIEDVEEIEEIEATETQALKNKVGSTTPRT